MGGKFRNPRYEDAESAARKNRIGLWKYNLNLSSLKGEIEKEYKPVNFSKNLTLLDIYSA
jgi:endonuclease YncB( thermonuclease family)